jgi:hypothetical protein
MIKIVEYLLPASSRLLVYFPHFSEGIPEEKETLEEGYKNHPKFHVRKRFHSLSSRPQIIDTFL